MKYHNYESSEKSAQLLDSILAGSIKYGIIATDLNGRIVVWNFGAEQIYGYTAEEMIGKKFSLFADSHIPIYNNILYMTKKVSSQYIDDYEVYVKTNYATTIPISVTITPRLDIDGYPLGYLIIIKDISRNKLQEKFRDVIIEIAHIVNTEKGLDNMLSKVLNRIKTLLEIPILYICLYNNTLKNFNIKTQEGLSDLSKHLCVIGTDKNSPCHKTLSDLTINTEELEKSNIYNCVLNSISNLDDLSLIHIPLLSGTSVLGILHVVIPEDMKNVYLGETQILSLIANEISVGIQRKLLEEELEIYAENLEKMVRKRTEELRKKDAQLIQSGKLAMLGEMATGIAHEINQPLGGISLITQGLLKAHLKNILTDELIQEKLNSIMKQITRIEKIINHLRAFGRQAPQSLHPVNVNKPLIDIFSLIGEQLKKRNIRVKMDLQNSISLIMADENRLEQIFLNIITNARDAMDAFEKKINKLKIKSNVPRWIHSWKKKLTIKTYSSDGKVIIEISDTGAGIPAKVKDKIFEPFFTTKEVGKGTGLGLSISYGIIKEFKGNIEFKTVKNRGTSFIISFPALQ